MKNPPQLINIKPHIVDSYLSHTPHYSPENAYLKLENYVDIFIEKGYCSKRELRWLKINGLGLDCMPAITFLNRFYDESGLQFVPITTENGYCELSTENVSEFVVLNKLFLKSQIVEVLDSLRKSNS